MKIIRSLFFVFLFALPTFVLAQSATTSFEKLWYLKNEPRSMASFEKNIAKIDIVGSQTYFLLPNGEVRSVFPEKILQLKNEKNINLKVMPLLANISFYYSPSPSGRVGEGVQKEYFDQKNIKNLLDDKKNWEKVAKYMVEVGVKNNFYGWQMDLENIPISHKEKFSEFIKYLKIEFDKNNLKLSVAVVSKISDNQKDYEKSYWQNWAGAYDWKVLADNTEFLSIMAYDQPESPGPVATMQWSKKVLDYAVKTIPKEKISFGIPTYAWVYRSEDLKKGKKHFLMIDFGFVNTKLLETNKNITSGRGSSKYWGDISWVAYNYGGKNYTIWYEDKNSFAKKYEQIKSSGVRGFSVWVLGDEDEKIWELFN